MRWIKEDKIITVKAQTTDLTVFGLYVIANNSSAI